MKMAKAFPKLLKHWRNTRRMSQLDLGLAANVSARHVSFLETGRSMPSRSMVMQLCQTLEVPLPAQNSLLQAAGFAEVYRHRPWNDQELAQATQGLEWTLQRHDPFPAMALDKHWTVIKANQAATLLLNAISNWQDVLRHMITRLRTESARLGQDETLNRGAANLALQLKTTTHDTTEGEIVLSTRYRLNGLELSLFSMLAQFSSTDDIALADVRVELMYPADEATRLFLMNLKFA
jgi:transcriptional regulator with XRE-family HTH domain